MKIFVLPLLLFVTVSLSNESTESEYQAIETTVNYYLQGGTNNDFETLKKAFHTDARMISMGNDLMNVNALEFFGSRMKPGPPSDRKTRVVDINMSGNAASARLEIEYADFMFVDYMSLLKINGEWKIVSKVYTRVNK